MERLAYKVAVAFCEADLISDNAIDDYAYALEMILVKFIGWLLMLSVALISGLIKELTCYIVFFSAIRAYGGGFHSKSLIGCLVLSVLSLSFPVLCSRGVSTFPVIYQGVVIISIIYVVSVGAVNNPYIDWNPRELISAKRISRLVILVEVLLLQMHSFLNIDGKYLVYMSCGIVVAALSMLIGYIQEKGGK